MQDKPIMVQLFHDTYYGGSPNVSSMLVELPQNILFTHIPVVVE